MMERHSGNTFRTFAQYVHRQFGMWVAILAGYQDSQGETAVSLYVSCLSQHTSITTAE